MLNVVSNVMETNNIIRDNTQSGLRVDKSAVLTAKDNTNSGDGLRGIILLSQATGYIENNIIWDNFGPGISFFDLCTGNVAGNQLLNNGGAIVIQDNAEPTIETNFFK